ncbi:MAG: glycerate kinase [Xanthomonadales bacterium]|nr:glycerate kinase [Xanthomonadales bacterium]
MRILIAPDKFKGSLNGPEVAAAIALGLTAHDSGHETIQLPVADGGEGTAQALQSAMDGRWITTPVRGPLGQPVNADWCLGTDSSGRTVAALDMSSASGIALLDPAERDPWRASTWGTGELIAAAMAHQPDRIVVGVGGSATCDGGSGMATALGFHFLDSAGTELEVPAGLDQLSRIVAPDQDWPDLLVACDVNNPLLGDLGAIRVYGPQKGVAPDQLEHFESRLEQLARCVERDLRRDCADLPGAGAAGGLGYGLAAFCGARLESGFKLVAEAVDLAAAISRADLVIAAEGRLDRQSLMGKAPGGVANLARQAGVPAVAFCGSVVAEDLEALRAHFDLIVPLVDEITTLEEALAEPARLLEQKAATITQRLVALARG